MDISELVKKTENPPLYEKGNAFIWNDKHISGKLLEIHLNPDIDLASRKKDTIRKTAKWIMTLINSKTNQNILDLGCGPGLYTEIFARQGHNVTGLDISPVSIEYAKKSAQKQDLNIKYVNADYLKSKFPNDTYDLITMIFTDLGVLIPSERELLLTKIFHSLKPGGIFVFDLLKDTNLDKKISPRSWECKKSGFWKNTPYLVLSDAYLYQEQKVILYQHTVIDQKDNIDIYRFWTHLFSEYDIKKLLVNYNFSSISFNDKILPKSDIFSGNNVIFTIIAK